MEYRFLGDITTNLDYKRRPLNSIDRDKISKEGLYPYIGANNILTYIDEYIFDEKILCIAEDGGSWGKNEVCSNIYDGKTWVNNHAHVLIENGKANLEFLRYYLNFADLNFHIKGSTRGKLTRSELDNIQIPLPSYENQIRIANLLEKIETTIDERKSAIDLLDELAKATFYQMFGDPVKNEKGWENSTISKIVVDEKKSIRRGPFGGALKKEIFVQSGYLVYEQYHALNNDFSFERYYIDENKFQELKAFEVKSGDIIISCSGVYLGKLAIVPKNAKKGIINQALLRLTLNNNLIDNTFFTWQWTNENFKKKYYGNNIGSGIPNFPPIEEFKKFKFILPPITLQNQFADIAQKIERIKAEQEAQLKDLEELYASISQKVFEGTIDLSKVPFDASLLPNPIKTTTKGPIEQPDVVVTKASSKETTIKEPKPATKGKLIWENVSFKEVSDNIRSEFGSHYFNAEMLLRFLKEDKVMQVNYFSSVEQKKNPQYENADDFYRFIATALTGENIFLTLEQVFYNAETENIPNISFTETDLENLSKEDKKERSGIYFRIKDETTTP